MKSISGQIFLSHASEDKTFVEKVYARIDASSAFYDIKSMAPGHETLTAMESGVENTSVFVLFHSPHSQKPWVNFEKELARLNAITTSKLKILVCPIGGETHESLPSWMQRYMTTSAQYKVNDIARTILYLQDQSISERFLPKEIFVGREDLSRGIELDILSAPTKVGVPVQHLLLSGIPGMGRSTVAKAIVSSSFATMKPGGPIFDLPDMADATDIHLRLKEDLDGTMSKDEIERQIVAFQALSVDDQASMLLNSLKHWAELNQVIVIRTRWGLRDRTRHLKPWLEALFRKSNQVRNLRIIYVSERRLPAEELAHLSNARQYEVGELSDQNIQYILSKKTESRYFNIETASAISKKVRGHPATAHHVAFLTNSGMSFDSINLNPEPIYAFQDKTLDAIFASGMLDATQKAILTALGWFPKLPVSLLCDLVGEIDRQKFIACVWDLLDYSLIQLGEGGYYHVPEVVSARVRRDPSIDSSALFKRVKDFIESSIKHGSLRSDSIDALIIAVVNIEGSIPTELRKIITSANLLSLVTEQIQSARTLSKGQNEALRKVYTLSKMAMEMNASDDAVEQILFAGGDAAIRAGVYPSDIISFMSEKALPSVYYLIGSYAFYIERDYGKSAKNLKISLKLKHFRNRNVRLLAKAYIRDQKFGDALDALNLIPEFQLYRDTGLLVLKIRALRGCRNYKEAELLEKQLDEASDDFGQKYIYMAGRSLRDNDFKGAEKHIQTAKGSQKGSHLNVALLECAIAIEKGDSSLLPETVELTLAAGRHYDAWQLQARMAIKQRRWADAIDLLSKIERKDFFDLQLENRALQIKREDPDVLRDPAALREIETRLQELQIAMYKTPEGFREA